MQSFDNFSYRLLLQMEYVSVQPELQRQPAVLVSTNKVYEGPTEIIRAMTTCFVFYCT